VFSSLLTEQEGFEPPLPERVKRFSRPSPENDNSNENKDLPKAEPTAYKPAYKQKGKKQENQSKNLPADLAEIVTIWPELPEHIKAAIKALIQPYCKEAE